MTLTSIAKAATVTKVILKLMPLKKLALMSQTLMDAWMAYSDLVMTSNWPKRRGRSESIASSRYSGIRSA